MPKTKLSRRTMLRGLLGGAAVGVSLPLLDVFLNDHGTALADGGALPRRFGIFFWGNGNLPDRFTPTITGPDWELTEQLTPLADVKSLITIVSGMGVKTGNDVAHSSGAAGIFSGASIDLTQGETFRLPSVDQMIANELGDATRFKSIETALTEGTAEKTWSFSGPNIRNPAESSPRALYERLFGEGFRLPGDEPIIDPTVGLRRSVLDAVMGDASRLRTRLGTRDRQRIDQHFEGIRSLERKLQRLEEDPPNLAACMRPGMPEDAYPDIEGRPQLQAVNRAMVDILAMTLACDQTRIFSHWFSHSVSNILFPSAPYGHHQLTHDEPGDQPEVHEIDLYIMTELAYMIQAFASVTEGDGTLLDNCAILATSDCSLGRQHRLENYPIILAGNAGGRIVQGTHYQSPSSENASKVLLSLVRAMGIPAPSFGMDAGRVTDGLGAIEV
jgi:hypothetical protein